MSSKPFRISLASRVQHALPFFILVILAMALPSRGMSEMHLDSPQGVYVRKAGETEKAFLVWTSYLTARDALALLDREKGGDIEFVPGEYELAQAIQVARRDNVSFRGGPGVTLMFPENEGGVKAVLATSVKQGDGIIEVKNASLLRPGFEYQLYLPGLKGGRRLEFRVAKIEGRKVSLSRPAHLIGDMQEVESGAEIVTQLNFFELYRANGISIEDFSFEGHGVGLISGHTVYTGVLAQNSFVQASADKKVKYSELMVSGNRFRNLKGRGVAVYATDNVTIALNRFENIRAECVEVDHFASARVVENQFSRCGLGIQLDDAMNSHVEGNSIEGSGVAAVRLIGHFDDDWVNTGNQVRGNSISRCRGVGIFLGHGVFGNRIEGNTFDDCPVRIRDESSGQNAVSLD